MRPAVQTQPIVLTSLTVTVDCVTEDGRIPLRFTAYDANAAPVVAVEGVDHRAVEIVLIVHDPDAPLPHGFTHWVRYGIAPNADLVSSAPGVEGPNDLGEYGWFGPRPPHGHGTHHYYFWVYVLDRHVQGTPSRREFLDQYEDAIIQQQRAVGTFAAPAEAQ